MVSMKKIFWFCLILFSCNQESKVLDIQGHRGARGLMPENTLPAFITAIDLGVTTLELDLVVTKDHQLLISHEPIVHPDYCGGKGIEKLSADTIINIYQLTYDQVRQFDCGSFPNPRFPEQKKMKAFKPLLKDALDSIERYLIVNNLPKVNYNIELKTTLGGDEVYHPTPTDFSDRVYQELDAFGFWDRITIQSFDFRTLQYFHSTYPTTRLALLIENENEWSQNIDSLGFEPDIYSCYYPLLSREIIEKIKNRGIAVIPWTVNDTNAMQELVGWGVDGIITDYPDRAIALTK